MDTITADVPVRGEQRRVSLVRCGLTHERHAWRVEAPGEDYDGWLMSAEDLTNPDPASLVRPPAPEDPE